MSGTIPGIDYSQLFATTNNAASILTALYTPASTTSTATTTGNPVLDLTLAQQNETKAVAREARDPNVIRDLAAFTKAVHSAKDIASALANPNVLKVLLTANGLADQQKYPALVSKILLSNPKDPKSLVNRLSDTRWKTVVGTYQLATNGLAGLSNPTVQSQLASAYERVTWLGGLDAATPGLAQALQFKKQAASIKNVDQILGDPINWEVVLTALGIPQQIAFQSLSAQEREVSTRLDIKQLQNPKFVNTLTDQYLLNKQQAAGANSSQTSGLFV